MENENTPQPLDAILTEHKLTNVDLVRASKEQLSFKMVQKGRKGRRLSPNIQQKILTALLAAKPGLNLRRRDLFRYEPAAPVVERIQAAILDTQNKKISYPEFVDRLVLAGISRYAVHVALNKITFFGAAGEAHVESGPVVSQDPPGRFDTILLKYAINDAQKGIIDHPTFLKRIYAVGVVTYETNTRRRRIEYKSEDGQSYREIIPPAGAQPEVKAPAPASEKKIKKPVKVKKVRKAVKRGKVWKSGTVKRHRVKRR